MPIRSLAKIQSAIGNRQLAMSRPTRYRVVVLTSSGPLVVLTHGTTGNAETASLPQRANIAHYSIKRYLLSQPYCSVGVQTNDEDQIHTSQPFAPGRLALDHRAGPAICYGAGGREPQRGSPAADPGGQREAARTATGTGRQNIRLA